MEAGKYARIIFGICTYLFFMKTVSSQTLCGITEIKENGPSKFTISFDGKKDIRVNLRKANGELDPDLDKKVKKNEGKRLTAIDADQGGHVYVAISLNQGCVITEIEVNEKRAFYLEEHTNVTGSPPELRTEIVNNTAL